MNFQNKNKVIYGLTIAFSLFILAVCIVVICCSDLKCCLKMIIGFSCSAFLSLVWIIIIFLTVKDEDIIKQNIIRIINNKVDNYILKKSSKKVRNKKDDENIIAEIKDLYNLARKK